jgi:hypothetical protein
MVPRLGLNSHRKPVIYLLIKKGKRQWVAAVNGFGSQPR